MNAMLNRRLFNSLKAMYGDVQAVDVGDRGDYERKVKTVTKDGKTRTYVNYVCLPGGSYGERYRLNCIWCGDTKHRLYISYLFGLRDQQTRRINYGNVHCFNDTSCHEDYLAKRNLLEDIELFRLSRGMGGEAEYVRQTFAGGAEQREMLEIGYPGKLLKLSEIDQASPYYPAVDYVRVERGYDLQKLEDYYGCRYLSSSYSYGFYSGRLWTPFFRNQLLVAWTARAIPALCDSDITHCHSPGGLGGLLYGLGGAVKRKVLCVVEGVSDRWAVGSSSVAILSKTISGGRLDRLVKAINTSTDVGLVVVLLDPDQPKKEREAGKPHPVAIAVDSLTKYSAKPVLPVFLPSGSDPGGCSGSFLASYLYKVLSDNGYQAFGEALAWDVLGSTASWGGFDRVGGKSQYLT